jgi:hypothetical protein
MLAGPIRADPGGIAPSVVIGLGFVDEFARQKQLFNDAGKRFRPNTSSSRPTRWQMA